MLRSLRQVRQLTLGFDSGYYRYWERAFMDAVVAALVGGVARLQAALAGQGTGALFRVRAEP